MTLRSSSVSNHTAKKASNPPLKLFPKPIHNETPDMPLKSIQIQNKSNTSINQSIASIDCMPSESIENEVIPPKPKTKGTLARKQTKVPSKVVLGTKENISALLSVLAKHVLECPCLENALKEAHLIN